MPTDHIDDAQLSDYLHGEQRGTSNDRRAVASHIDACAECRLRLDQLSAVVTLLRRVGPVPPPRPFVLPDGAVRRRRFEPTAWSPVASLVASLLLFFTVVVTARAPHAATLSVPAQTVSSGQNATAAGDRGSVNTAGPGAAAAARQEAPAAAAAQAPSGGSVAQPGVPENGSGARPAPATQPASALNPSGGDASAPQAASPRLAGGTANGSSASGGIVTGASDAGSGTGPTGQSTAGRSTVAPAATATALRPVDDAVPGDVTTAPNGLAAWQLVCLAASGLLLGLGVFLSIRHRQDVAPRVPARPRSGL